MKYFFVDSSGMYYTGVSEHVQYAATKEEADVVVYIDLAMEEQSDPEKINIGWLRNSLVAKSLIQPGSTLLPLFNSATGHLSKIMCDDADLCARDETGRFIYVQGGERNVVSILEQSIKHNEP